MILFVVVLFREFREFRESVLANISTSIYIPIYSNENITKIAKWSHCEFPHLVQNHAKIYMYVREIHVHVYGTYISCSPQLLNFWRALQSPRKIRSHTGYNTTQKGKHRYNLYCTCYRRHKWGWLTLKLHSSSKEHNFHANRIQIIIWT